MRAVKEEERSLPSQRIRIETEMKISDLTRLYGATQRALRFYEERGLIRPRRDRLNQRYYDAATQADIEVITKLRRLGVGLKEIRAVLEARRDGSGQDRRLIASALAALKSEFDRKSAALEAALRQTDPVACSQAA